jgi:hypothetical protein
MKVIYYGKLGTILWGFRYRKNPWLLFRKDESQLNFYIGRLGIHINRF